MVERDPKLRLLVSEWVPRKPEKELTVVPERVAALEARRAVWYIGTPCGHKAGRIPMDGGEPSDHVHRGGEHCDCHNGANKPVRAESYASIHTKILRRPDRRASRWPQ